RRASARGSRGRSADRRGERLRPVRPRVATLPDRRGGAAGARGLARRSSRGNRVNAPGSVERLLDEARRVVPVDHDLGVRAGLTAGCRVHAVLPPISAQGTCLSIRVPPREPFTIEHLVELGAIAPEGGRLLQRLVDARLAFVVSGGTGSGKTTVLSALLSQV